MSYYGDLILTKMERGDTYAQAHKAVETTDAQLRKADAYKALSDFIEQHCAGKEYDSCKNSPCPFASSGGCIHPKYPKVTP